MKITLCARVGRKIIINKCVNEIMRNTSQRHHQARRVCQDTAQSPIAWRKQKMALSPVCVRQPQEPCQEQSNYVRSRLLYLGGGGQSGALGLWPLSSLRRT